jgi:NADH-quinone oxidoreductase subunit L
VCLLLFVGATGKSAQIPLHVWLPDAMEGPTPVSALIHAATMVTAGVYMVARMAPLFSHSATAMWVVAVIGAATALMAATIAVVQTDIKRVLAYSTISQLGYMFLACGVGAFGVGVFHLFTHAFFKALLFLGAGSVIHALSGEQDMRRMGGLARKIPWTFGTFAIGTAAIAGIPPLAGFFSKDEILASALHAGRTGLFLVGLFTAFLTAFYMARLLFLTFFGAYRGGPAAEAGGHAHGGDAKHTHESPAGEDAHAGAAGHAAHAPGAIHESPWTMLVPLALLALGSAVAGFVALPAYLRPVFRLEAEGELVPISWLKWMVAPLTAIAGIAVAYYLYVLYPAVAARLAGVARPVRRVLEAKYFIDDAYNWVARRVVVDGSATALWRGLDAGVIDGAVNGSAALVGAISRGARTAQTGLVRGYALLMLGGAVALLGYLLWL